MSGSNLAHLNHLDFVRTIPHARRSLSSHQNTSLIVHFSPVLNPRINSNECNVEEELPTLRIRSVKSASRVIDRDITRCATIRFVNLASPHNISHHTH